MLESESFVPGTSSLNLVEGATLHLACKSKSNDSVRVRWWKQVESLADEEEEVLSDSAFNVYQNVTSLSDGNEVASVLRIVKVSYENRAFYTCRVANAVTTTNLVVLIRVKDKMAALWPFLAIVAEVLVLCTIIFVYEKRRTKAADLDDDAATVTR